MEDYEQYGGKAYSEDDFQDQESGKFLRKIEYIILWDHDRPVDIRKIAKDMNVSEEKLAGAINDGQIEVVSYMWIHDCIDSGKKKGTRNFMMDLDMGKIYRGS